jgi:2,3-bisphosphoglycerate-independent phosphoglycerate mutase
LRAVKYAIVLPDGAADEPVEELEGRTPLQAAKKPNMDWIASYGRQGCVVTVPSGFAPGSDVATLSLLGYDPRVDYTGRAPLEAAARGIAAQPDELIFRCNFVTLVDEVMADFTAGHISQPEADRLIDDLNRGLGGEGCRFFAGVGYRNLMIAAEASEMDLHCTPPHDIPDRPIADHWPEGTGSDRIRAVMMTARRLLAEHEVNLVRRDLGENPATDIWLWGQGRAKAMEAFAARFGVRAAAIAAVDLIRGIARTVGMDVLEVAGATGYLDTNYAAKGAAATEALASYDLVVVHIEAPDEAGHLGDAGAKVAAIERIDECIVGPLLETLRRSDEWRILIAPDHPTPVGRRVHSGAPPPFCMAGHRIPCVVSEPFSEAAAAAGLRINPGHELMEYFLHS